MDKKCTLVAKKLGLDINNKKYLKQFIKGCHVELEHGTENPLTNITDDNLILTGKIALAHMLEYPDYYVRLKKMEKDAHKYWKNKKRPEFMVFDLRL